MTDSTANINIEEEKRGTIKVPDVTVKRLHKIVSAEREADRPVPTFAKIVEWALDAYENSPVTGTGGQSTPGTGNNRLQPNEAKYSKALAKIGLIVREVLSAQGQTAANAKSQISKTKKRTPSLAKTNRMLDEIKGGAPKDSGTTGKTGGIAS